MTITITDLLLISTSTAIVLHSINVGTGYLRRRSLTTKWLRWMR